MRAIRVHELGGPDVMRLETVADPSPGPGEVLVRIEAIGLNFIEVYFRKGLYKTPLPFTPGSEGAGTVVAVGAGVNDVAVGDRVASQNFTGSYAELALAKADRLVRIPDGLNANDGAAAMLQGMTAHYLATSVHTLKRGDRCLVHAAAGGVGSCFARSRNGLAPPSSVRRLPRRRPSSHARLAPTKSSCTRRWTSSRRFGASPEAQRSTWSTIPSDSRHF